MPRNKCLWLGLWGMLGRSVTCPTHMPSSLDALYALAHLPSPLEGLGGRLGPPHGLASHRLTCCCRWCRAQVSGKPIKFVGVGEKMDSLEPFYPERMASRILGMGDVLTLYEKAESAIQVSWAGGVG